MTLRAVVVEDSPTQRAALVRILEHDGDIAVVATAEDAEAAVATVARHAPEVVTMDLEIPRGGGTAAIRRIMAEHPAPVLVLSGLIEGPATALAVEALAAGAVDAAPKPPAWDAAHGEDLRRRVRRVASIPVVRRRAGTGSAGSGAGPPVRAEALTRAMRPGDGPASARAPRPGGDAAASGRRPLGGSPPVVGVAASTGGPAALALLLPGLRELPAPVLVVQHIHESFVDGLAAWLGKDVGMPVVVARTGERPRPGTVHLAPAGAHLVLGPDGRLALTRDPAGALHRPSADILLQSLAEQVGCASIGVILTGMGDDGARGLRAIRDAGGTTLAQEPASCAVFGMPRAARDCGATSTLLAPRALAGAVRAAVREAAA